MLRSGNKLQVGTRIGCRRLLWFGGVVCVVSLASGALCASWATRHFVDPIVGDDLLGDGSEADPWRTVKLAFAVAGVADTVELRQGVYDATNQGGSDQMLDWSPSASDVLLRAYPGENVVVDYADVSIPSTSHGVILHSSDSGATIHGLTFANWEHEHTIDAEHVMIVGADDVTLRGCTWVRCGGDFSTVRARAVGDGSVDLIIEDCTFEDNEGAWKSAVYLGGGGLGDRFTVSGCTFNDEDALSLERGGRPAIWIANADSALVVDCFGYNPGHVQEGQENGTDFITITGSSRVRVERCAMVRYLNGWQHAGVDHPLHNSDGILVGSSEDVWIEDCAFWGAGHGIEVLNRSRSVHLSGVYTDSTFDDGVFFDSTTEDCSLTESVIHHSWDNGVDVKGSGILVAHNTIVRTHFSGISVWGTCEDVTVRDNIIVDQLLADPLRGLAKEGSYGDPAEANWDHNLHWSPDPVERVFDLCDETGCDLVGFGDWQASGNDLAGLLTNPLFAIPDGRAWPVGSTDFALLSDSPGRFAASDGTHIGAIQADLLPVDTPFVGQGGAVRVTSPFRLATTFRVDGRIMGRVGTIGIYDVKGRLVDELAWQTSAPSIEFTWDGRDRNGHLVPEGVYFFRARGRQAVMGRFVRVR
jgi:hypothetical protein